MEALLTDGSNGSNPPFLQIMLEAWLPTDFCAAKGLLLLICQKLSASFDGAALRLQHILTMF